MRESFEVSNGNRFFGTPQALVQLKVKNNYPLKTGQSAYDDLRAYLKIEDKNELDLQLQGIEVDEVLAKKIIQGDWETLFKEYSQKFPNHALLCLKKGLISDLTFSTSQLFFNVWTHEENVAEISTPMQFIPVFNSKKERTIKADKMIDATMKIVSSSWKKWLEEQRSVLIDELQQSFLKGIAEDGQPCSYINPETIKFVEPEQRFWHSLDSCANSAVNSLKGPLNPVEFHDTLEEIFLWMMNDDFESEANKRTMDSLTLYKKGETLSNSDFSLFLQKKFERWFIGQLETMNQSTNRPGF